MDSMRFDLPEAFGPISTFKRFERDLSTLRAKGKQIF
jgi:hypothetical protein